MRPRLLGPKARLLLPLALLSCLFFPDPLPAQRPLGGFPPMGRPGFGPQPAPVFQNTYSCPKCGRTVGTGTRAPTFATCCGVNYTNGIGISSRPFGNPGGTTPPPAFNPTPPPVFNPTPPPVFNPTPPPVFNPTPPPVMNPAPPMGNPTPVFNGGNPMFNPSPNTPAPSSGPSGEDVGRGLKTMTIFFGVALLSVGGLALAGTAFLVVFSLKASDGPRRRR